ncbi:hypothetical protein L1D54_16975 [Vibrio brasiliensis]|jgi:hypothetical protein|uniref:hypothetical protein n=1 Tax=Vibrio brasiliensis TaxID=170652 RepID=UPI001EFCD33F|nr:hypothetical protein [Vibrio brasiliensis]MCG9752167.1 hypothetical protein [Vibrio brasiliensis]
MKIEKLMVACLTLLIGACNSTSSNQAKELAVLDNAKSYSYESIKVPSPNDATPYDYVFYAAKKADKMKFKRFALVHEYSKDKHGIFRPSKFAVFMFNGKDDFIELKRFEKPYRKLKLLGIFETEEYKDKRFIPIGHIPGAA